MKATLRLENIGQKIGEEIWEFNSGVVTEIRGRTASGKSRILKACALILSLPITSDEIRNDAVSFGISKASNTKFSPLLNSNKNKAIIELQYDDISKIVELNRDGTEKINIPGDQKFLYCSTLTENSKIHSNIEQGISDFSWIVSEMSHAKDYEAIKDIVDSYSELLNSKKEEIKKKDIERKKNEEALEKKKRELIEINNIIEIIDKDIDDLTEKMERNRELQQNRRDIINKLKNLNQKQTEAKVNLKNHQRELSNAENNLKGHKNTIERNKNKMAEIDVKIKKLKEINESKLNDEIDELRIKNERLLEVQIKKSPELNVLENDKKRLETNLKELIKTGKSETICWTCNITPIQKDDLEKQLEDIDKELKPKREEISRIEKQIRENKNVIIDKQKEKKDRKDLPTLQKEIKEFAEESINLTKEIEKSQKKIEDNKKEINKNVPRINGWAEDIKLKEEEKKNIDDKLKEDEQVKPKIDERNNLAKKLGAVEKEVADLENKIEQGAVIELLDFKIDMLKSNNIFNDLDEIFGNIEDHLNSNIKEQREGAALKFNENIEKIIKELNFSEFKEISLDLENSNLNIIRKDNTYQPINSLSGGEKVVISSLLQISAKETYNRDIPFIVGDDIILKMDDERREVFENYLKTIAKENDWFIILTRITDEDLIKVEI